MALGPPVSRPVIPTLNMQIPENKIHYGPTPWRPSTGQQAYFSFDVTSDVWNRPDVSSFPLTMWVGIMDSTGTNLVATLSHDVEKNDSGVYSSQFQWDGTDDDGNPLPPGDYAPTFSAMAPDGQTASASSCTGLTMQGLVSSMGGGDSMGLMGGPDDFSGSSDDQTQNCSNPDSPSPDPDAKCCKQTSESDTPPPKTPDPADLPNDPYGLGLPDQRLHGIGVPTFKLPSAGLPSWTLPDFSWMDFKLPDFAYEPFNLNDPAVPDVHIDGLDPVPDVHIDGIIPSPFSPGRNT